MSRAKGFTFERAVADVFRAGGFEHAERRPPEGVRDRGDISGVPQFVIECKAAQRLELAQWLAEAEIEREHAGTRYAAVVVKRRQAAIERGYFLMELRDAVRLLHELEEAKRARDAAVRYADHLSARAFAVSP
jgi:hypothetical protein